MEFRNYTPFPALAYLALDQQNKLYHVVAMRQSLAIQPNGTLKFDDQQTPLAVTDEYFGELNRSSVKQESDLAPYKPKCDVIVVGSAYAPNGRPARSFQVNLRVIEPDRHLPQPSPTGARARSTRGKVVLNKTLIVTGPRYWKKHVLLPGWELTAPEPITSLPLRYEYAYGGELKLDDVERQKKAIQSGEDPAAVPPLRHTVVEANPVGRGYAEKWFTKANKLDRIPAPQIEDPGHPIQEFATHYPAQGFGVITKAWLPRRALCGTADDTFAKSNKWLPDDFDFAYWNGAHPDLQVPYLKGDESIELTHLTPEGSLHFQLPGHTPYVLVRVEGEGVLPLPLNLDTLLIDTEKRKVALVYRMAIAFHPEILTLEARQILRSEWEAALNEFHAMVQKEERRNNNVSHGGNMIRKEFRYAGQ